ncbi:MAG TPA: HNH endonuclease signature motif containing protein [Chthonomonadaceae bacterium]|nr:HNH endonuclease signature motif containing protein [Chthonomonadaceae bacterium]
MRPPAGVKREVRKSARNRCEYCHSQEPFSPVTFSIEHIVPRSNGGEDVVENLALSCQECNNHKFTSTTARDTLSGEEVRLFHPRRDRWSDHFAWNEDFTLLLGLTATGRATIEKMQLNRASLINLRRVLYHAGFHPLPEED